MNKAYHIIVADDDKDDQMVIEDAICSINPRQVRITHVYNGEQLCNFLNKTQDAPDLIILDINMPKVDGLVALEKIKSDPEHKSIPVYILSTLRTPQRYEKSMSLGAKNYYTKPNFMEDYKKVMTEIFDSNLSE
jgi:CheY-like chemotaxis protein